MEDLGNVEFVLASDTVLNGVPLWRERGGEGRGGGKLELSLGFLGFLGFRVLPSLFRLVPFAVCSVQSGVKYLYDFFPFVFEQSN